MPHAVTERAGRLRVMKMETPARPVAGVPACGEDEAGLMSSWPSGLRAESVGFIFSSAIPEGGRRNQTVRARFREKRLEQTETFFEPREAIRTATFAVRWPMVFAGDIFFSCGRTRLEEKTTGQGRIAACPMEKFTGCFTMENSAVIVL